MSVYEVHVRDVIELDSIPPAPYLCKPTLGEGDIVSLKKETNFDWLRSLSDEDFAIWCANLVCNAKNRVWLESVVDTKEGWLSWLREEK